MMEVAILTAEQISYAVMLSRMVYDQAVRDKQTDVSVNIFFDEYMNEENIKRQVEDGALTIWGICENRQLVAVSGMTNQGHITMLYVHPYFQRKKYASMLIEEMRVYAAKEYDIDWITVNTMPTWSATYFYKRGFKYTNPGQNFNSPYISLQTKSNRRANYRTRPISGKALATVISVFLCLIFGSSFGYIIYFLVTH